MQDTENLKQVQITWATDSSNSVGSTSLSLWIFFLEVYILKDQTKQEIKSNKKKW